MSPKRQRLILALIALAALVGAGLLAVSALSRQASYFYTPSEIAAGKAEPGRAIRLGGLVAPGSVRRSPGGERVDFAVVDRGGRVPVSFAGIVPDLFREGSGVVAEGRMAPGGRFIADNLLAKHDENYRPRELKDMSMGQEHATGRTVAR